MNKTLAEEELDRELVVRHREFRYGHNKEHLSQSITKAKISNKTFSISENTSKGPEIQFQKSSGTPGSDELAITLKWHEKKTEKCSLGHEHEISKKEREYQFFRMDWEHVELFTEWLKNGSWAQVKHGQPQYKILAREMLGLIALIEKCDEIKVSKPHVSKFKNRLNEIIKYDPKESNEVGKA